MNLDGPALSLFAGIGGFEKAFLQAGINIDFISYENWSSANEVLHNQFSKSKHFEDVCDLPQDMHSASIVTAGFPCTDLSSAGRTAGLDGSASGLIKGVLSSISVAKPEWVLLENVPNMIWLNKGSAISFITSSLEAAGYKWAYRMLDAQFFGLNQRRRRVFLLASRSYDPKRVLFRDLEQRITEKPKKASISSANGFYWTEGNRGLGWGSGVVPTIKGSTTASIPSSPGVWIPDDPVGAFFRTPSIESLELMQGFEPGWTSAAPSRDRWKLVGNAVAVPVVTWILEGIKNYQTSSAANVAVFSQKSEGWDLAGHSSPEGRFQGRIPEFPQGSEFLPKHSLKGLLQTHGSLPLSQRATTGFMGRLRKSTLSYPDAFMRDLIDYSSR